MIKITESGLRKHLGERIGLYGDKSLFGILNEDAQGFYLNDLEMPAGVLDRIRVEMEPVYLRKGDTIGMQSFLNRGRLRSNMYIVELSQQTL